MGTEKHSRCWGGGGWMTLPPSASSAPAPSSAAGQVAGGRPTSADFSPFPNTPPPLSHSFISCRHCSFPTGPCAAQLAGVAVRSRSQPTLANPPPHPRTHTLFPSSISTAALPDIERGGSRSEALEMGEQWSVSIFYGCYLALELIEGRAGLSF